ncbi:hypothetical protein HMI54_013625, partial [Coelomomyces lativittatus]
LDTSKYASPRRSLPTLPWKTIVYNDTHIHRGLSAKVRLNTTRNFMKPTSMTPIQRPFDSDMQIKQEKNVENKPSPINAFTSHFSLFNTKDLPFWLHTQL